LYLYDNHIKDVSPLAKLTSLESLDLTNNQITDISSLAGLTSLEVLYLTGNAIPSDSSANAQPICPVSPPDICYF
ncbi:MAG: leucine-rich repeat domain-containing protein, partial [Coleofasciculus sp. C2-GNP5-27]